jgi:hypothetical protein
MSVFPIVRVLQHSCEQAKTRGSFHLHPLQVTTFRKSPMPSSLLTDAKNVAALNATFRPKTHSFRNHKKIHGNRAKLKKKANPANEKGPIRSSGSHSPCLRFRGRHDSLVQWWVGFSIVFGAFCGLLSCMSHALQLPLW